jgi:hypothetical protein
MIPMALFSLLFETENACLPVGREDARLPIDRKNRNAQLWIVRQ